MTTRDGRHDPDHTDDHGFDDHGFDDDDFDGPAGSGDHEGPGDGVGDHDGAHGRPVGPGLDDPRVQAGIDHLQRAAREVIAASRALLDVAEELVEDPRAVGTLADVLASVGDLAARAARNGPADGHRRGAGGRRADADGDDDPPVQRIPIS